MLNEFEVAIWIILNEEIGLKEKLNDDIGLLLMMTALKAKSIAADKDLYKVFETFLWHNNPQFMEWYSSFDMGIVETDMFDNSKLSLLFVALYSEVQEGSDDFYADTVEDYNFIVDSLEEEHVRRTVHTTKTAADMPEGDDGKDWIRSTDIKR
jgi:hypothetical protein